MKTQWVIDSNKSDVLIKSRHALIDYMDGSKENFKGHIALKDNELEDASIEFSLNVSDKNHKSDLKLIDFYTTDESSVIQFKSTSFQKVTSTINFLKGNLTIKNITKVVELDTEFIGYNIHNGVRKATFEIIGNIKRKDFELNYNAFSQNGGYAVGSDIKLIANLEFTTH